MSRKQSAVERIRKKAAAPSIPAARLEADPFHNGQTPSCRLLLQAVHDIFPELQQEMKHPTPSSELGKLLRWQILTRRKARALPPAPPLLVSPSPPPPEGRKTPDPPTASKKKRKRKKKKKDNAVPTDVIETNGEQDKSTESPSELMLSSRIEDDVMRGSPSSPGSNGVSNGDYNDRFGEIEETESLNMDPVSILDRSIHELEEKMIQEAPVAPSLNSLPSDGAVQAQGNQERRSSLTFFQQIQPDESEPEIFPEMVVPLHPPSESSPRQQRTPTKGRPRLLSSSSFESFEGTTLTPKESLEEPDATLSVDMGSPTHEWVPEEGGETKIETPIAEVIKNPLDLKYLLNLSSNGGRTTMTIDGSLISAAQSETQPGKPDGLQTTKILLEEWMGQLIGTLAHGQEEHKKEADFNAFIRFLQSRLWDGEQPVGIPLADLRQCIDHIDCCGCKLDATAVVDQWSERPSEKPLVLNPAVLQDEVSPDASDVDTAFDYVALEEGHHLPMPEPPNEEDGDGLDLKSHLSFHVSNSKSKKAEDKCIYVGSITKRQIEIVSDDWMPCGVEEEILVATSVAEDGMNDSLGIPGHVVLSIDETTNIERQVLQREKGARDHLDELDQIGKDLKLDMTELLSSDGSRQNVEFKAFPKLKMLDQKTNSYNQKLQMAMTMLELGRSEALSGVQVQIWTVFLGSLNKALQACERYYDRIGDLVDQRGVVPKFFVNANIRGHFQTFVEEKIEAWTEVGSHICNHLGGRTLKELYTTSVWCTEQSSESARDTNALDEKCYNLVRELAQWTETIMGSKMADIQKERMAQTEHMLELLQAVVEPLSTEYSTVEKYFTSEKNRYFAGLRSNIVLAQGVKKRMRLIDNAEVEGMTTGVLLMWCHVRVMQSRMIRSQGIPPLPLQLKRWMMQEEPALMEDWRGLKGSRSYVNSYHQRYCRQGRGGKRRAMCSLAGLFYNWLQDQFKIWIAETAEKELLNNFDFDTHVSSQTANSSSGAKTTKSKKNKKKKNRNTQAAKTETEAPKVAPEESHVVPSRDLSGQEGSTDGDESSNDNKESTRVSSAEEDEPLAPGLEAMIPPDTSLEQDIPHLSEFPPDDTTQEEWTPVGATPVEVDPYVSKVFVQDGQRKVSALDFLVERLQKLMDSPGNNVVVIE